MARQKCSTGLVSYIADFRLVYHQVLFRYFAQSRLDIISKRELWEKSLRGKREKHAATGKMREVFVKRKELFEGRKENDCNLMRLFLFCLHQRVNFLCVLREVKLWFSLFSLQKSFRALTKPCMNQCLCNYSTLNKNDIDSFDKINILRNSIFWQMQKIFRTLIIYSNHTQK